MVCAHMRLQYSAHRVSTKTAIKIVLPLAKFMVFVHAAITNIAQDSVEAIFVVTKAGFGADIRHWRNCSSADNSGDHDFEWCIEHVN